MKNVFIYFYLLDVYSLSLFSCCTFQNPLQLKTLYFSLSGFTVRIDKLIYRSLKLYQNLLQCQHWQEQLERYKICFQTAHFLQVFQQEIKDMCIGK